MSKHNPAPTTALHPARIFSIGRFPLAAQEVKTAHPAYRTLYALKVLDINGDVGVGDNQIIVTHHLH